MAVDEFKLLLQVGKEVRAFAGFGQFQQVVELAVSLVRSRMARAPGASADRAPVRAGRSLGPESGPVADLGAGPGPRQSFTATLSGSLTRLQGFRRALPREGIAHLFLAEEGFLPGGLKRREPRLAWWPDYQQPTLLPDNSGVSP